jgi:hypothetical protein
LGGRLPFWLSELVGLFLRYLGVGLAFAPAGLVYSLAVLAGWDHWLVTVICLALGFVTASVVWRKLGFLEVRIVHEEQVTEQGAMLRVSVTGVPWLQVGMGSTLGEPMTDATTYVNDRPPIQVPEFQQGMQLAEESVR